MKECERNEDLQQPFGMNQGFLRLTVYFLFPYGLFGGEMYN